MERESESGNSMLVVQLDDDIYIYILFFSFLQRVYLLYIFVKKNNKFRSKEKKMKSEVVPEQSNTFKSAQYLQRAGF